MISIVSPTTNTNDMRIYAGGIDITSDFDIAKIEILPDTKIKVTLECLVKNIDIGNKVLDKE